MESFLEFFLEYRHNLDTGITPAQGTEAPSIHPTNNKGNNIAIDPMTRKHPGLAAPYKETVAPGLYQGNQLNDILLKIGVNFETLQQKRKILNFKNSGNDAYLINGVNGPMVKVVKNVQPQMT